MLDLHLLLNDEKLIPGMKYEYVRYSLHMYLLLFHEKMTHKHGNC